MTAVRFSFVFLLLAGLALGQTATFQPISPTLAKSALGVRGDLTVWVVSVQHVAAPLDRETILQLAPAITAIPPRQVEQLLSRDAYRDPRSALARLAVAAVQMAPVALAAAGVATGSPGYSWAGVGTAGLSMLIPGLQMRAPSASLISASDLLPATVTASGRWYVISSPVAGAAVIGPVRIQDGQ